MQTVNKEKTLNTSITSAVSERNALIENFMQAVDDKKDKSIQNIIFSVFSL